MKKINVKRAFMLQHPVGIFKRYAPGEHEVEDDVADHSYVQHFIEPKKFAKSVEEQLRGDDAAIVENNPDVEASAKTAKAKK